MMIVVIAVVIGTITMVTMRMIIIIAIIIIPPDGAALPVNGQRQEHHSLQPLPPSHHQPGYPGHTGLAARNQVEGVWVDVRRWGGGQCVE